jgi:hypothetical protein
MENLTLEGPLENLKPAATLIYPYALSQEKLNPSGVPVPVNKLFNG